MTEDEQEALSHQHSHGFWLVPLSSGRLALFDHPNGKLLRYWIPDTYEPLDSWLTFEGKEAAARHEVRRAVSPTHPQPAPLDIEINL